MADSTRADFLFPPSGARAGVIALPNAQFDPEEGPSILSGQGTPNGDIAPFNLVNKGSLYMAVDQTDDTAGVWQKVDQGGDNADWVRLFVENQALIDTNDFATAAGITLAQLAAGQDRIWMPDVVINISNADEEHVVFHAVAALTITEIGLVWTEATDSSGAAVGDVTIGTASGGAQIVAATAYDVSQAVGDYQALSLASGAMGAGTSMFLSHDQVVEAGEYRLQFKYDLD